MGRGNQTRNSRKAPEAIVRIEDQIVDTQAVTMEGVLVQVLFLADIEKDEDPQAYDGLLINSMSDAAMRLAPGLAEGERLRYPKVQGHALDRIAVAG